MKNIFNLLKRKKSIFHKDCSFSCESTSTTNTSKLKIHFNWNDLEIYKKCISLMIENRKLQGYEKDYQVTNVDFVLSPDMSIYNINVNRDNVIIQTFTSSYLENFYQTIKRQEIINTILK